MEYTAHDLLNIRLTARLCGKLPLWAARSLEECPWAVVRRAPAERGAVPVGIRGNTRAQRCAAVLPEEDVRARVSPPELAARGFWREEGSPCGGRMAEALEQTVRICRALELPWGPVGSVGFALATGRRVLCAESDLDLALYCGTALAVPQARALLEALRSLPVPADALLETPEGAVALTEYVALCPGKRLLLRTMLGPRLVLHPWGGEGGATA